MKIYRISELVDLSTIQKLAEGHYQTTGMPIGIVDAIDGSVLVATGWQDICTLFHRAHPSSLRYCQESDNYIKGHLIDGEACQYRCKNGLWDIGVPIMVAKRHLATIFLGQFFYDGETPDQDYFIRQAQDYGYNLSEYLAALDRVPVFSKEKVDNFISYNKSFSRFIADLAERSLRNFKAEEELRLAHDELENRVVERTEQLEKIAKELRRSEERYALAVHGSNDGIWDLNLAIGEAYHSPRWKSILGYQSDEIDDNFKEWESRVHPDDFQRVMETGKAYEEGRIPEFEVEYRLRHEDGSYRWVLCRGACLRDSHGKPYRMAGSLTDITERKKLEQRLLQAQKMESVGILAGGVAHDFNNLLTAISGYGQILLESIPEGDELSQESIRNVLNAADRAAELTKGLLAFSRKQVISPKPLRIDILISETGRLIQRSIGEDIQFSTNFTVKNLVVTADPGQIEQVLMNLAANARDAMPHGGHLSITTSRVVAAEGSETLYDLPSPGEYALISVADTGTGIDKKTLESIFEPFYTTKEIGKGTGLGLAIVHGIIKQHNGSILASSEPGKGTTFDIYLPLAIVHAVKEESHPSAPHAGGTETLLVAEDDENVRMFMKKILERAGYKVISAHDGEEAVTRLKEHNDISIVLSDVVMPRKNGREMLDEIKKIKPGIKAVFVSGYAADAIQNKGVFEEGPQFLIKPFKKEDLLRIVRQVLDKG